jgi:hypothetical protein
MKFGIQCIATYVGTILFLDTVTLDFTVSDAFAALLMMSVFFGYGWAFPPIKP